jgi:hypothetical protein
MYRFMILTACIFVATPAVAQTSGQNADSALEDEYQQPQQPLRPISPDLPGRTADSSVGEVGKRITRDDAVGIAPMGRIAPRIQNRIQSRIRNRIDRNYDPQANARTPFAIAEEQSRAVGRRP